MIPLLDLKRSHRTARKQLESAAQRVLASGQYILGPEVARLEQAFAKRTASRHGIGVASGTDALELSLRALGVGAGDWVATVSFTFIGTVDAILQVGAKPLFVDIDPATYTMDPIDLENRIHKLSGAARKRLKAVIPVHLFGHPCNMTAIGGIARRYHLAVVEDCAQAAGATWRGRPVGSFGQTGCFSFFPTKTLGGFGDGGMVVTRSAALAQRLRSLRQHGRDKSDEQATLGRNSRLDALQAALLNVKLRGLSAAVKARQRLARSYNQALTPIPGIYCPLTTSGAGHAFCLYVIRAKGRTRLQGTLRRQGIASQVYYATPVHRQPLHRKACRTLKLPQTDAAAQSVLALPIFPEMPAAGLKRICRALHRFYH